MKLNDAALCWFPPALRDLLKSQRPIYQLDVMARADRLLTGGRYFNGVVNAPHVMRLTERLKADG